MIKLTNVTIHRFKGYESEQSIDIDQNVTIIVGMNESGKTAALEALAKTNYFQEDNKFKFDVIHDYPRRLKKQYDKIGDDDPAVTSQYSISKELQDEINKVIGNKIFTEQTFKRIVTFDNKATISGIDPDPTLFLKNKFKESGLEIPKEILENVKNSDLLIKSINENPNLESLHGILDKFLENKFKWTNWLGEYIYRTLISPNIPKYLYYDEYYSLPSRISIESLKSNQINSEELKTAKALFELADINVDEILKANSFENFKAELEATEAIITDELFKYWETNQNLNIEFAIDKIEQNNPNIGRRIVEHVLDIRVKNSRSRMSLPLKNRSKGFNWFFSFLVWFKKIQEDKTGNYILLLDEPGLNLHAKAQENLLKFIEDLSANYQIIYTTHSPFMIDSVHLERIRTVVELPTGSTISDSIQEKDQNTLFPLQAALGYNLAQNLFISKHNLLVEGVSDLIYLEVISSILEMKGKKHLDPKVTIVPVGGLDKVTTFISLLRGNKLNIVCLLDTFNDQKTKDKLDSMIKSKIIHEKNIRFFHEFIQDYSKADLEDLFKIEDYISIFNSAFKGIYKEIEIQNLQKENTRIISQINTIIQKDRFNHYIPANILAKSNPIQDTLSDETLNNFERVFIEINSLFNN
ncbi:AAA family ATPase [Leptospira meyeri]|uniref:AAA family ATPase n=1 Tax=Leptospira meyeri TaxID=29508 RepID=UPI0002BE71D2|nr:AAA family ATPase [Leptospira meyeri]EMJ89493.1 AAA ATPase domain protein [Leptospira meyeri serovar Semaranga str. Veldrot Semarang 173]